MTDCQILSYAFLAAGLAIASTALAVCAYTLAYVARQVRAWRVWDEGRPDR